MGKWWGLEVQPSYCLRVPGEGKVLLHYIDPDIVLRQIARAIGFRKKAALILMPVRPEDFDIRYVQRFTKHKMGCVRRANALLMLLYPSVSQRLILILINSNLIKAGNASAQVTDRHL